jgi:hypothetical protein
MPPQPHHDEVVERLRQLKQSQRAYARPGTATDVKNLSMIASRNLEKERENSTYMASQRQATSWGADIMINNADTELNFEPNENDITAQDIEENDEVETFDIDMPPPTAPAKKDTAHPEQVTAPNKNSPRRIQHTPEVDKTEHTHTTITKIDPFERKTPDVPPVKQMSQIRTTLTTGDQNISPKIFLDHQRVPSQNGSARGNSGNLGTASPRTPTVNSTAFMQKILYHPSDKGVQPIVESATPDFTQLNFPK